MSIKDLVSQAKKTEDQSVAKTMTEFEYTPPVAGPTFGRFIEYIELGNHVKKYEGKDKPSAPQVRVTFELVHPKNIKEIEVEGGGKKQVAERISQTMPKSTSDKAKFFKLFKTLQAGRDDITHIAEMLGEGFIINIKHNEVGEGKEKKVFANIYEAGTWHISQPVHVDVLAGTSTPIPVPEALSPLKLFLWDIPTQETWDSLYIDGEREVKNAKGEVTGKESKNWLQENILSATNYPGSALEIMLNGMENLPTGETKDEKTEVKSVASIPPSGDTKAEEVKAEVKAETQTSAADALAAMGLTV